MLILREAFDWGVTDKRVFESKRFRAVREQPDTIYLTNEEVKELAHLTFDNHNLEIIRDLFLIGCYTSMRYCDHTNIAKEQIDEGFTKLRYKQYNRGQLVVLPIKSEARILLLKYVNRLREINALPEVKYNSKTNAALKIIGRACPPLQQIYSYRKTNGGVTSDIKHAKWEKLSTHTARRTFATNELKDGTPISLIMAATGHVTEKSFRKYIRATPEEKATLLELQWKQREVKTLSK